MELSVQQNNNNHTVQSLSCYVTSMPAAEQSTMRIAAIAAQLTATTITINSKFFIDNGNEFYTLQTNCINACSKFRHFNPNEAFCYYLFIYSFNLHQANIPQHK